MYLKINFVLAFKQLYNRNKLSSGF